MIQHQCTVLQTLNHDVEQYGALTVLYRSMTVYAAAEAAKSLERLVEAEKRYGVESTIVKQAIRDTVAYHDAMIKVSHRFKETLEEYETALTVRIDYFNTLCNQP